MTIDHGKQFVRGKHFVRDLTPGQRICLWTKYLPAICRSNSENYRQNVLSICCFPILIGRNSCRRLAFLNKTNHCFLISTPCAS